MKVLLLLAALVPLALGITQHRSCARGGARPHTVSIAGCPEVPCLIHTGDSLFVDMQAEIGK